jgi:nicotinamide phosphoribosyltransferase
LTMRWLNDEFEENFFKLPKEEAMKFAKDMSLYLGMEYNGDHFGQLHDLQYLPIRVKSLPEGIETDPNIPHMTFINTVDGFAWLTLYLETIISSLAWKPSTSATIALQYRRNATEWVMKTDPDNAWLIPYLCHDFSARGLSPWDMLSSGLGHATSFRGSDTLICIPGARYFYGEPYNEVCINSVNASEHSVSTTKIFTVGEKQMILDWLKLFPKGILSVVADTFSLWKFIEYLSDPEIKAAVLAREGKLVVRPDSGDPVDIICGNHLVGIDHPGSKVLPSNKGVIELLWDIFGGSVNKQGYKVLDSHIGAIYGDSINLERQVAIYQRLATKGFATTNIVLGVGSFTYQFNTRDTLGFAAKGAWFEILRKKEGGFQRTLKSAEGIPYDMEYEVERIAYDIYKDPVTDDGTKKSLKGLIAVFEDANLTGVIFCKQQCTPEEEEKGLLKTIFENGKFYNLTTFEEVRKRINSLV